MIDLTTHLSKLMPNNLSVSKSPTASLIMVTIAACSGCRAPEELLRSNWWNRQYWWIHNLLLTDFYTAPKERSHVKPLHQIRKNSLFVTLLSSLLVSAILVACGGKDGEAGVGSGSTAANAGGPSVSPTEGAAKSLAYDLEGFKKCGEEFSKNITLSTKTHVAWGQIAGNKLVYLFNAYSYQLH